jgi:hypothetical protein
MSSRLISPLLAILAFSLLPACASKGYKATEYRPDGTIASTVEFSTSTVVYGPTLQDVVATDGNRTVSIGSEKTDVSRALDFSESMFKAFLPLMGVSPSGAAAAGMVSR